MPAPCNFAKAIGDLIRVGNRLIQFPVIGACLVEFAAVEISDGAIMQPAVVVLLKDRTRSARRWRHHKL